jgi:hypothetical protein
VTVKAEPPWAVLVVTAAANLAAANLAEVDPLMRWVVLVARRRSDLIDLSEDSGSLLVCQIEAGKAESLWAVRVVTAAANLAQVDPLMRQVLVVVVVRRMGLMDLSENSCSSTIPCAWGIVLVPSAIQHRQYL